MAEEQHFKNTVKKKKQRNAQLNNLLMAGNYCSSTKAP